MNISDILYLLFLFFLICLSAIFSATETALNSSNVFKIKVLAKKGHKKAKVAYKLIKRFSDTLTTVLVFNNVVNILSSSIATYLISLKLGASGIYLATIIMTIVILFFGEIIPKVFAKEYSEEFLLFICPFFAFLVKIMFPICKLVNWIEKIFMGHKKDATTSLELLEIAYQIEHDGNLKQEERELIQNVVEFDDKKVKDVMRSKEDVIFLYDNATVEEIKRLIIEQKYSRIPVVCHSTGRVIGILHEGDILDNYLQDKSIKIIDIMRDVIYLTKNRRLSFALEKVQKTRNHLAIVIDNNEDNNFLGIITLEDILEELVGEIYDEYDDLPKNVLKIGLHTYQIDPNINVISFFEEYLEDVKVPKIDSKTFVGWLNEIFIHGIKLNAEFKYENIKIKVLEVANKLPTKLEIVVFSNFKDDIE